METKKTKGILTHPSHTIQYTDKAIADLKYIQKNQKRNRLRVNFKNGPVGVSLRWTPKSNKKAFCYPIYENWIDIGNKIDLKNNQ